MGGQTLWRTLAAILFSIPVLTTPRGRDEHHDRRASYSSRLAPVPMLMAPSPVFALPLGVQPCVIAVVSFPALLHQPVAVRTIFRLVPFVPIAAVVIIVPMSVSAER